MKIKTKGKNKGGNNGIFKILAAHYFLLTSSLFALTKHGLLLKTIEIRRKQLAYVLHKNRQEISTPRSMSKKN